MRTKHILTALALPALFAACTADDFVNEGANAGLQERAKLSKDFKLITSDASTRYTISEQNGSLKFNFTEGDKVGAAIVDEYVPSVDPAYWDIIYSLAGNTPFEYKGNDVWQASSELGVGHYIYVYPYNAKDNNRAALSFSLPTVQNLFTSETGAVDLDACIKANNKAVYAALLTEGETQLEAQFKNLYAYPKFVINFDNGEPITEVTQVVLKNNAEWQIGSGLNHKKVAQLFVDAENAEDVAAYWASKQTADFLIASTDADYASAKNYGEAVSEEYIIAKLPKGAKVSQNSITNNKYIEVRFMIPGAKGAAGVPAYNGNLTMYIYTNNGIYEVNNVASNIAFKSTTPDATKEMALARNTSYTLQLNNAEKSDASLNIVTNVKDWNDLVAKYGASAAYTASSPFRVAIVGDEFKLDASAKMPSKAIFEITTPVDVEGAVTLSNLIANEVTVKEGAVLTTSYTFTATSIVNKGEVVVAPEPATTRAGDNVYSGVFYIHNYATLTIPEGANAQFYLANEKGATVTNEGTLAIYGTNAGTITNKSVLNTISYFTNITREYKNTSNGSVVVNEPTIVNEAGAKILAKKNTLTNYSKIENSGVFTCKNESGEIKNGVDGAGNAAVLDSKKDALSYITNNEGKVIVYDAAATGLTIGNGNNGIVEYTTSAASESFKGSLVNYVIAAKDYAITEGAVASLTLNGKATLKVTKDKATVNQLIVAAGTTTLGTDLSISNLQIAKGAMVVVPEGKTLTVSGSSMKNAGTILVGGTFSAASIAKGAEGTGLVEDNGNGTITWKKTDDQVKAEKQQKAFTDLVNAWIKNTGKIGSAAGNAATWSAVTPAFIASTNWAGTSAAWAVEARDAFIVAYNATVDTAINAAGVSSVISADAGGYVAAAIKAAKAAADADLVNTIKKYVKTNAWVGTTVYVKTSAETKFEEIANGTNLLVDDFTTYVHSLTVGTVGNANWLSMQAVNAEYVKKNSSIVPAYSYIDKYEGGQLFDAVTLWKKITVDYNLASTTDTMWDGAKPYRYATVTLTANTMERMKDFFNEVNKIDTADDIKLTSALEPLKAIAKDVVLDWNYTDAQVQAAI